MDIEIIDKRDNTIKKVSEDYKIRYDGQEIALKDLNYEDMKVFSIIFQEGGEIDLCYKKEERFIIQTQEYFTPIQQQLIDVLKKNGAMSRNEICKAFDFEWYIYNQIIVYPSKKKYPHILKQYNRRTTIYDNLVKLEKKGIVERFSKNNGKVGASVKMWKLTNKYDKEVNKSE